MNLKHLALCIILCAAPLAAQEPTWYYLPQPVAGKEGISFFFENTPASRVTVTVDAMVGGKLKTITQDVDTDRAHGKLLLFKIDIDKGQWHRLARVVVGGYVYFNVESDHQYRLSDE